MCIIDWSLSSLGHLILGVFWYLEVNLRCLWMVGPLGATPPSAPPCTDDHVWWCSVALRLSRQLGDLVFGLDLQGALYPRPPKLPPGPVF